MEENKRVGTVMVELKDPGNTNLLQFMHNHNDSNLTQRKKSFFHHSNCGLRYRFSHVALIENVAPFVVVKIGF